MFRTLLNIRLVLICFAAVAVALPIAIIGLAKLLLFLCAVVALIVGWFRRNDRLTYFADATSPTILLVMSFLAVSSLWSTGSSDEIFSAIAKHGKLILIPIFLYLIRSHREARIALAFFIMGQIVLLMSTWLLVLKVPLPWAISKEAGVSYAVFSSYLDQSIMTAVLAAVCWHMRSYVSARTQRLLMLTVCGLALACVFFVFQGRTGHVVALAMVTLAIFWQMPKKFRIVAVVTPIVLLLALAATSSKVRNGLTEIGSGIEIFNKSGDISASSSGTRLNLWHRSLQSMAQNPWVGSGVGSWNQEFNRQEALHAPKNFVKITGNPHQEYLLWGVELGALGVALLLGLMLAIYRDSLRLDPPARWALQSAVAALALASLFNSALYDALIGDFFCVTIALILAFGIQNKLSRAETSSLVP
jgi:O-antigen ligase